MGRVRMRMAIHAASTRQHAVMNSMPNRLRRRSLGIHQRMPLVDVGQGAGQLTPLIRGHPA